MKKLNNKGFSLVELIIVIAIMAILVGVVGTQVIPYLENSRKAKDIQVLSAWNTAGVSAYSTEAGNLDAMEKYEIQITPTVVKELNGKAGASKLLKTFLDLTDLQASGYDFQSNFSSKCGKAINDVRITINGKDGEVVTRVNGVNTTVYTKATLTDWDTIENK